MKRRVLSLGIALALCLNLCPVWVLAADGETENGLCPHHPSHTDACGYALPVLGQECTHNHDDGCYTTQTNCTHTHTAECFPDSGDGSEAAEPLLCTHTCTEDSGCITRTLTCSHEHDDVCGYVPGDPGAPCTFVCQICRIQELIDSLPGSVSEDNSEQVQTQIGEIFDLYDGLSGEEQQQVDLSPCASLLEQIDGMGSTVLSGESSNTSVSDMDWNLTANKPLTSTYAVEEHLVIRTNSFAVTGSVTLLQVTGTGVLDLEGTVQSSGGTGVEVQAGGTLRITGESTHIQGTYALDIASGATVQLSAGTYVGKSSAIQTADGDFAALLAPGCAYFDGSGNPILPENVAALKTVTVGQCTGHSKVYTPNSDTPTHRWTCQYCGTSETEKCTFNFVQDGDGTSTCADCGNRLTITVDESTLGDLVYDSTDKTADVTLTVQLGDGTQLVKDTDYTVSHTTRADAGEITVTVTGITFNGTYTKTYHVEQDQPGIKWDSTTKTLDYDGNRTSVKTELPNISITIKAPNNEDLHPYIQYSYRKTGDTAFTNGLPLDAGTYEIKAYLEESQNYKAAETNPLLTLTINKINPVTAKPSAVQLTYNRSAQALVTAGTVDNRAVGAEIQFAESETGPWSTDIPTGTNAGDYTVWYKVVGLTDNYIAPDPNPAQVSNVKILRKLITPVVELSQSKYQYDGEWKEPGVTVKDNEDKWVLPNDEYQVTYKDNRDVGMATVEVSDKPGGNYEITTVAVHFQITSRAQATLSITNKPSTFIYGDEFTLETSGGSGNGDVTWEITSGQAQIGQSSGHVTITGHGDITVKATKSGKDPATGVVNYEDATASWTFTAVQKPVTATVTVEDKTYDGNTTATVHAVVEQGVLPGDEVTITGLTGTFDNENAGVDKTVTVDFSGKNITGNNSQHYDITYSAATVKATIRKAVAKITTAPVPATPTYNGTAQALIATAAVVDPNSVQVEYALSKDDSYSADLPKGTNAGTYTVWYRVKETDNYTGLATASVEVTIAKKPVSPTITLDQVTFVYDGNPKEPGVTLYEADGTTLIPAGEYTMARHICPWSLSRTERRYCRRRSTRGSVHGMMVQQ